MAAAVDWADYFYKIKQQCPWSYLAWSRGQILVRPWGMTQPLGDYAAIVYVTGLNKRRLKKLCDKLNDSQDDEWLWSCPGNGPYATPVAVLIQQDRHELTRIRQILNKGDK